MNRNYIDISSSKRVAELTGTQDRKVYICGKRSFYFPWRGKGRGSFIPPLLLQIWKVDTSSLKGEMKLDYILKTELYIKCENIKILTHKLNIISISSSEWKA